MNPQYKKGDKILKDIIKKNVKPANNTHEINTIIYYKNLKVNNLIMYNDLTKDTGISTKSHAVYEVLCPIWSYWRLHTPKPYWPNKEQCENPTKSTSTKRCHTRTAPAIS